MTELRLLYVTTKDVEEARALSRELLARNLIACANIFPTMESIYRWEGKVQSAAESVLILKTKQDLVERTIAAVEELHSYDVPCVLSLPIEGGAADYLHWIICTG